MKWPPEWKDILVDKHSTGYFSTFLNAVALLLTSVRQWKQHLPLQKLITRRKPLRALTALTSNVMSVVFRLLFSTEASKRSILRGAFTSRRQKTS